MEAGYSCVMIDSLVIEPYLSEKRQLRIALVTETYPPDVNGVALTLSRIVEGLRAKGHDVWLVRPSPTRQALDRTHSNLIDHHSDVIVRGMPIPMYPELKLGLPAKRALVKLWTQRRPDVVHIATEGPLGWSAIQAAKKLRLPITSDFRTNFHAYSAFYGLSWLNAAIVSYMRKFHNSAHCTMVPTTEIKSALSAMGFQRLIVIPRGIDNELFCPSKRSAQLRKSWGADESTLVLISVGRLAAEKNLDVVLKTFLSIRNQGHDIRLVFVGDGPLKGYLARRCPEAIFCGVQRGEALASHFASGDIFLFPSLTETFGNVTIEAMACGLAVVAFKRAAAKQLIVDGVNGLLVESEDHQFFINQVQRVVIDRRLRHQLGHEARQSSLKNGWASVLDETEEVLRRVWHQNSFNEGLVRPIYARVG
jgi:glycosyltransferase involved in cell wall biosynthesis